MSITGLLESVNFRAAPRGACLNGGSEVARFLRESFGLEDEI